MNYPSSPENGNDREKIQEQRDALSSQGYVNTVVVNASAEDGREAFSDAVARAEREKKPYEKVEDGTLWELWTKDLSEAELKQKGYKMAARANTNNDREWVKFDAALVDAEDSGKNLSTRKNGDNVELWIQKEN